MIDYILGLDIGIGSVGWAVINLEKRRIEDFGVRIFESGEIKNSKRESQVRRAYRAGRRLIRRRSHRKHRLKKHLEMIGFTTEIKLREYFESGNSNIISIRAKALDEKISPEELSACLIHICNNRGYNDFYSIDEELLSKEELEEYESDREAIARISSIMKNGGYRTVGEMIFKDSEFNNDGSEFRKYHNSDVTGTINLIKREDIKEEVSKILKKQSEYYECLTSENIDIIKKIIFSQRAFEDGPGDVNDKFRKYTGFLDTLGKCRFYTDEKRGARFTAISDVYALVNTLSQYHYFDENGEFYFNSEIAEELIDFAIKNGNMTKKDLSAIAKKFKIKINDSNANDTPITKCLKYLKSVKPIFEEYGYDWEQLVQGYVDTENNLLNKIGVILSQYQTPSKRILKLKDMPENLDEKFILKLSKLKFSGTTNVSYKFMDDSISAFLRGDIYGRFQANIVKEMEQLKDDSKKSHKLSSFKNEDDCEFFKNPVVFRSINETRKIINAIIDKYGQPCAINIETADEVNRSFEERRKDNSLNNRNEKENDRIKSEISKILNIPLESVRPVMIEKYKLWEAQEHKCLYSGKAIDDVSVVLDDKNHLFEIDHIVPYSLILDNTLNNKALVYMDENQIKGQRTPLMYMKPENVEAYKSRVNAMLRSKKCSKKKYQYLMLQNLDDSELLSEWKSRNLNDTRYIAKYLVNYLKNSLIFNPKNKFSDGLTIKEQSRVFAVKSKFVSNFRKQWLNPMTWGRRDKGELKKITYLDHAADAIVIANCRPEYVILAGEKMKLYNIYKNAGKRITDEYNKSFNDCVESLYRYYGVDRVFSKKILKTPEFCITPIVPNLYNEVDNRLRDYNTHRKLFGDGADKDTDEQIQEVFVSTNKNLYSDDPEFAGSLKMPVISYKPERKYTGEITDANAISVKKINGKFVKVKRVDITKLKKSDYNNVYTGDIDLLNTLDVVFKDKGEKYTVKEYLDNNNLSCFVTLKGRRINKVTVTEKELDIYLRKDISENNFTIMNDRKYYCLEIYKTKDDKNNVQGIAMADLLKKNGKLYFKKGYEYPEDYDKHVMYLFKGDYIRIYDSKNKVKFEGYYLSSKNVNENRFYAVLNNGTESVTISVSQKDRCIKLNVDILGNVSGFNDGRGISCGEPLSLLEENE